MYGPLFFSMGLTVLSVLSTKFSVTSLCPGRFLVRVGCALDGVEAVWRFSCPFALCTPQMACTLVV